MFIQNLNLRKKLGMCILRDADAGAGGTGDTTGTGTGAENGNGEGDGGKSEPSFDDFLKDSKNQSEFDKRIAKALETAKSKWEAEKATELENAKTEAEKLAKMNAEQKAKYAEEKRAAELEQREKDITTRELRATAYETLAEKELPKELVDILNYESAEACNKSIEVIEKAWSKAYGTWQQAVEKVVNEKLRGGRTPKDNKGASNLTEQIARAVRGQ